MRTHVAFVAGFLLALLLGLLSRPVSAQLPFMALGSNAGTQVPLAVSSTGVLSMAMQ